MSEELNAVERVTRALDATGIAVLTRACNPGIWKQTEEKIGYVPVMYTDATINYRMAYMKSLGTVASDVSVILYHDQRPCGIWPLSVVRDRGRYLIGTHGGPILPPIFVSTMSPRSVKRIVTQCLEFIDLFCMESDTPSWESVETFQGYGGLSEWHVRSKWKGAHVRVEYDVFVDLSMTMADIKARFRKSYRALLNVGLREWTVNVMAQANKGVWDAFRHLHLEMAGRQTRDADSWEIQYEAICAKRAFLVYLTDSRGEMVGGSLVDFTINEGFYAVGAYDRRLFDKPLGHIAQYRAMEALKERGVRWYRIGARSYSTDIPTPTDKQLTIGEFKEGFATHLMPSYRLSHPLNSRGPTCLRASRHV